MPMPINAVVLIRYVTEYDHYQIFSTKELRMGWFRSLLRLCRPIRRKIGTTRLYAGFRAFHEFERSPQADERFLLPYTINGVEHLLPLLVNKVGWPRSRSRPCVLYCELDTRLSAADRAFLSEKPRDQGGIFTQNILNETERIIGRTRMTIAQMLKFHELVYEWNLGRLGGLAFWFKKKEIKNAT